MAEVAKLLDFSPQWVANHLKRYAVEAACGGVSALTPLAQAEDGRHVYKQIDQLVKRYAPSKLNQDYIAQSEADGHSPETAKLLARSYEAAENAIDAGVLKETKTQEDQRVLKIVLPAGVDWTMRLRSACADVKSAAGLLDRAQITDLKRAITRKLVASAHAAWMEQIERIENFHPTFLEEVSNNET